MATQRYRESYRKRQTVDPARRIAFTVLLSVETEDAFANIELPQQLRFAQECKEIDHRDAAFASELTYGSLRNLGYLDWVLAAHMTRPIEDLDPSVRTLLRLGTYQLLKMRVPEHAAVSTTVDMAREYTSDGPAKFINAVLRSITRSTLR